MKHSLRAFISFYLGKILAVAGVCLASSLAGHRILDENGYFGGVNLHHWLDLCMIAMGIWFVYRWIREYRHPACENCHHCGSSSSSRKVNSGSSRMGRKASNGVRENSQP